LTRTYSPVRKLLATDQVDAFDCGPTDPYHLFLMLKDLKGMLR